MRRLHQGIRTSRSASNGRRGCTTVLLRGDGEIGLPLNTTQLRAKVAELTQTRVTPFKDGIPGKLWLKWFKNRHPNLVFRVLEGLDMNKATLVENMVFCDIVQNDKKCPM